MVREDWAEILRANPGRANWSRHNAQCLPLWKQSGPTLSADCAQVGPMLSHLGLMLGASWAYVGPSRAHVLSHVGPILGVCWAKLGPSWAHVGPMLGPCGPMLGLCWPTLSHLGTYVGAMFRPSMLKRSTWPNMGTTCAQHRPRLLPYRQALRILPASVQHSPPPTHPRRTPGLLKRGLKDLKFTVYFACGVKKHRFLQCFGPFSGKGFHLGDVKKQRFLRGFGLREGARGGKIGILSSLGNTTP